MRSHAGLRLAIVEARSAAANVRWAVRDRRDAFGVVATPVQHLEPLAEIADRIVSFFDGGSAPPFPVYQYEPANEYAVRRELVDLRRGLEAEARSITCRTISPAEMLSAILVERGQLDMIVESERAGDFENAQLARVELHRGGRQEQRESLGEGVR